MRTLPPIQPVFVIQVTSQMLLTKFSLAEAHPTVMAPKRLLVCVGLFMQSERAPATPQPFIHVVLQVPVQMFLLAEDLLAQVALKWLLASMGPSMRVTTAPALGLS